MSGRVNRAERANQRASRRLQYDINGQMSAEHKFRMSKMEQMRQSTRKELAVNELARRKVVAGRNAEEQLKEEREKERRRSNVKMLERSRMKMEGLKEGRMKMFMDKINPQEQVEEEEKEEEVEEKPKEVEIVKTKIPSMTFEESYKEARKSRYVRSNKLRDFEVELTTDEVFKR